MKVQLIFGPKRTREYTVTVLDFVNDFFVTRSYLFAVCSTDEAHAAAGQALVNKLREDCKPYDEMPYQVTNEHTVWHEYVSAALNEAIERLDINVIGYTDPSSPPKEVTVVMLAIPTKVWGKFEPLKKLKPLAAFADDEATKEFISKAKQEVSKVSGSELVVKTVRLNEYGERPVNQLAWS